VYSTSAFSELKELEISKRLSAGCFIYIYKSSWELKNISYPNAVTSLGLLGIISKNVMSLSHTHGHNILKQK
jgi:hypothetical protein